MKFTLNGEQHDVDPSDARARLAAHPPEPIQTHWVELDGRRWPPKQALEVVLGVQRAGFTTYRAAEILRRLGLATSRAHPGAETRSTGASTGRKSMPDFSRESLRGAVEHLADFMDGQPLTTRVAELESALHEADAVNVESITQDHELDIATLTAALTVRAAFGRVSDVIHALVITLALPRILNPGEVVTVRPSLAAGNDPTRLFDLETNQRVAEFKVSAWTGADAMRKRGAFVDLVHVALDETERKKYVYVLGQAPGRFLETSISSAAWGFTRKSALQRQMFEERWGPAEAISIADFRATHARHVHVVDLYEVLPELQKAPTVPPAGDAALTNEATS